MQLGDLKKRMPSQLSGGQKQRIAIARAIVARPSVLLLDEPLGALDLQLRRKMQSELKALQKQLGLTFVYITHDQEEALNMSDRIAVMKEGRFQQIGTPSQIYDNPRTSYVAEFVGEANLLKGRVRQVDGEILEASFPGGCARIRAGQGKWKAGDPVTAALRSEYVEFADSGIPAKVLQKDFAGGMLRIRLSLEDGSIVTASRQGIDLPLRIGQQVFLAWDPKHGVPVDWEAEI